METEPMTNDSISAPPPVPESRKPSEPEDAIRLAHWILNDHVHDLDSVASMLSRQLLRALERETLCRKMAVELAELTLSLLDNLPPDMHDLDPAKRGRAIVARIIEAWR
jgi:hypothetical protein